jgi:Uma2 family endonuclease
MSTASKPRIDRLTHEEYFALEQAEDQRYEYFAGEVFAMAGGSEPHALIASNALAVLHFSLRDRPCRVYNSDMKLYVAALDHFCYPDVQVLCKSGRRYEKYVEGAALVVEVLSDSTESYDRGLKFEHYRAIPELRHYLLLAQDRPHAELFTRWEDGSWRLTEAAGMEAVIPLSDWVLELPLAEVYRNVDFSAGGPDRRWSTVR